MDVGRGRDPERARLGLWEICDAGTAALFQISAWANTLTHHHFGSGARFNADTGRKVSYKTKRDPERDMMRTLISVATADVRYGDLKRVDFIQLQAWHLK